MANVDPKLTKEVARLLKDNGDLQAVFTLSSGDKPLAPAETESSVRKLLSRAEEQSSSKPKRVQVFRNLQSFSIEAPAQFIQHLMRAEGVDSAALNSEAAAGG